MEKKLKVIKAIAVLLVIVLISVLAFAGINKQVFGVWINQLEDYKYGMELDGYRQLRFGINGTTVESEVYVDDQGNILGKPDDGVNTVSSAGISLSTEATAESTAKADAVREAREATGLKIETRDIKTNDDASITKENFDLTKKIIQERLETIPGYEYNIRMDDITGDMIVEVPDDENIDLVQSLVLTKGKIDIIDHQTGERLIDNSDIDNVSAISQQLEDGSVQVYMTLNLNEEGTKELAELSKEYISSVDGRGTENIQYITVRLDEQELMTTFFGEEIPDGQLNVPMGEPATDETTYNEVYEQLLRLNDIINGEMLPLVYDLVGDEFVRTSVTDEMIALAKIVFWAVILVVSLYMIIMHKVKGLVLSIVSVGYIAILSLLVRYTQITVTFNALVAFILAVIINYIFIIKFLNGYKDNTITKVVYRNVSKEFYISLVPVMIIAVIFTCMNAVVITSIGTVLFWGLLVQALYNALVIRGLDLI